MKIKKLVFAGMLLISGLTIVSAQIKLSFNPEKGKKYEYQTEMIQNMKQNVMGQEIPIEIEMNTTYLMEIKDKTPQEIHMKFTYQNLSYIISSPMMKMEYDSKNPNENPSEMEQMFAKMFNNLINESFMLVVAPDGSVKSVTGMDAIFENMIKAISDNGQVASQMGASMRQQFSDNAMKNTFEQSFKFYPANAVKVGDSWNIESSVTVMNMSVSTNTKYTLKGVTKNVATIAVESDIEMNASVEMEGKLSGTQTGTTIVDTRTGMPVTGDMSQNMKGVLKVQGMDVQMELATKMKTSTKEVK